MLVKRVISIDVSHALLLVEEETLVHDELKNAPTEISTFKAFTWEEQRLRFVNFNQETKDEWPD